MLLLLSLVACSNGGSASNSIGEGEPPPPPAPSFMFPQGDNIAVTNDCGGTFDVCSRVTCVVENRGNAAGQAQVELSITRDNKPQLTQIVTTEHIPGNGGVSKATYDFTDVSFTDTNIMGHCRFIN